MLWKNRKKKYRLFMIPVVLAAMAIALSLGLTGCGTDDIDISGYADETITIAGVTDEDITLTVSDLKAMDCITKSAESTSDKIGKVRATGPTLDTVLAQFGISPGEVKKIRVFGRDDYDAKLDLSVIGDAEVILAFGIDGQPLGEEDAPVRIVIPGSDSAWWVRMVERIELED